MPHRYTRPQPSKILFAGPFAQTLVAAVLDGDRYRTVLAADAATTKACVLAERPDLILMDVRMPGGSGIELCQDLKQDDSLPFIPLMLVTGEGDRLQVVQGFAVGADDYVERPVDPLTLSARVRALLRTKNLYELALQQSAQIQTQLGELETLNAGLESKIAEQVAQLQRLSRLKRFVSARVAERILAEGDTLTTSHRREITALFIDLRGFTSFAEAAAPDAVMELLRDYHSVVGDALDRYEGTLEHFAGDGIMAFFNDPVLQPDHTDRALHAAVAIRASLHALSEKWRERGLPVGVGIGLARGIATLGYLGYGDRLDYAAIGPVPNRAARLCSRAKPGQILVDGPTAYGVRQPFSIAYVGNLRLKGMPAGVQTFEVHPQATDADGEPAGAERPRGVRAGLVSARPA